MFTPRAIFGLSVLLLGSFGASYSSPYSRPQWLRLAPCSKIPQYSLPFTFASDLRTEALADRQNGFVTLEQDLASTHAFQRGLVFSILNRDGFQETLANLSLVANKLRARLLIANMKTNYHLKSSAPCGDAFHFISKFVQEQGWRLELRGGCSAEEDEGNEEVNAA
jgi:hypothetical protein